MMPIYNETILNEKVAHLKRIYPSIGWPELFELTPQIMEIVEIVGYVKQATDQQKHEAVNGILSKLMEQVTVSPQEIKEVLPLLVKIIDDASKGKYGINKVQDLKL